MDMVVEKMRDYSLKTVSVKVTMHLELQLT